MFNLIVKTPLFLKKELFKKASLLIIDEREPPFPQIIIGRTEKKVKGMTIIKDVVSMVSQGLNTMRNRFSIIKYKSIWREINVWFKINYVISKNIPVNIINRKILQA